MTIGLRQKFNSFKKLVRYSVSGDDFNLFAKFNLFKGHKFEFQPFQNIHRAKFDFNN